ncbi:MAG: amidohydrolase family protein [Methanoregula sp.]
MRTAIFLVILLLAVTLVAGCSQQSSATVPVSPSTTPGGTTSPLVAAPTATPALGPASGTPSPATTPAATPFSGNFIDTHAHIRPSSEPYTEIIRMMDEHKIDRMIVMEPPGDFWISGTPPSAYGIPDAAVQYPDRFLVLYSGEAGSMLYDAAKKGTYTPEQEKEFISLLDRAMASGKYRGIGEIGLRHQPPPGMAATYDITVPADHPWMFSMADIAARYSVPLDLHMQADDTNVAALERLLDHNPGAIIIWDHAGDHTQNATPDLLRTLLAAHKNLYTSIKIRTEEKQLLGGIVTKEGGVLTEKWKNLIADYPDRFIIGTDVKLGIRPNEIRFVDLHSSLLSQLPADVAQKVAQDNPKRIFNLST